MENRKSRLGRITLALMLAAMMTLGAALPAVAAAEDPYFFFNGFTTVYAGQDEEVSIRVKLDSGVAPDDAPLNVRLTLTRQPGGEPAPEATLRSGDGRTLRTNAAGVAYMFPAPGLTLAEAPELAAWPGKTTDFTLRLPEGSYALQAQLVEVFGPGVYEDLGQPGRESFTVLPAAPHLRFEQFAGFGQLEAGTPAEVSFRAGLVNPGQLTQSVPLALRLTFSAVAGEAGQGSVPVSGVAVQAAGGPVVTDSRGQALLRGYSLRDFAGADQLGRLVPFGLTMPAAGAYFLEVALVDARRPDTALGNAAMFPFMAAEAAQESRFSLFTGFADLAAGEPGLVSFLARLLPGDVLPADAELAFRLAFTAVGNAPGGGGEPVPGIVVQAFNEPPQTTNAEGTVDLDGYEVSDFDISPAGIGVPFTVTIPADGAYFLEVALVTPADPDTAHGAPAMHPFAVGAAAAASQTRITFSPGFEDIYAQQPVDLSLRAALTPGAGLADDTELAFRFTFSSAGVPGQGSAARPGIEVISGWADESAVTNDQGEVLLHGFTPAHFADAGSDGLLLPFTLVMPAEDAYFLEVALVQAGRPDLPLGDSAMQPFMVQPGAARVDFDFNGFDDLRAGEKSDLTMWTRVMYSDAVDDGTPLAFRLQLLGADGQPVVAPVSYRRISNVEIWQHAMTDADGYVLLPERLFTLGQLWPLRTADGLYLPLALTLPAGDYILRAALADATGYRDVAGITRPAGLAVYGEETFDFTVSGPKPEVTFSFAGFRNLLAGVAGTVRFSTRIADNGAVDPALRLRHQLRLTTASGEPVPGVAFAPAGVAGATAAVTDAHGLAWLPADRMLTLQDSPALLGAGLATPLRVTLPRGAYVATVQLMEAMDVGYLPLGEPRSYEFKVGANQAPEVTHVIGGRTVTSRDVLVIDLEQVFTDADREPLTYAAASATPEVASAAVDGATLLVSPLRVGSTTISVTATDRWGAAATAAFWLTVESLGE